MEYTFIDLLKAAKVNRTSNKHETFYALILPSLITHFFLPLPLPRSAALWSHKISEQISFPVNLLNTFSQSQVFREVPVYRPKENGNRRAVSPPCDAAPAGRISRQWRQSLSDELMWAFSEEAPRERLRGSCFMDCYLEMEIAVCKWSGMWTLYR